MHFYELIKNINEPIDLFIDMDGVISSYDFGKPLDFKNKRPLLTNIKTLKKISMLDNVNLFILSVCRKDSEIELKNDWLDIYAPFFEKDKRNILSKESLPNHSSANLKLLFLKNYKSKNKIVLVDDDIRVLNTINEELDNILLYQDSELID